jgi:hypothetical protein
MTTLTPTRQTKTRNQAIHRIRAFGAIFGTLAIAVFLAVMPGSTSDSAFAATPFSQCNDVDNTPGLGLTCSVTITNTFNVATGVGSSVTVLRECHGAGNTAPSSCITSSRSGSTVISSVSQCNGSINGGGGTVICDVRVTNNITGASTLSAATVNQCIGSGGGGGTEPTLVCSPLGSTTSATVTQCNGSANGGGGSMRVRCNVLGSTSASGLQLTINQCNGSANGGGSTVTCSSQVSNILVAGSSAGSAKAPSTAPGTQAAGPSAAELSQREADQRSAGAVQSSLASLGGSPSDSSRSPADSTETAVQRATDTSISENLAHAGFDAAVFVGSSAVALLIGVVLWIMGNRKNRTAKGPMAPTPAHV